MIENWRTTLFGIVTAAAGAAVQYLQTGGLSWQECAVAAIWAVLCYMVPDAKEGATKAQLNRLVETLVAAKLADKDK